MSDVEPAEPAGYDTVTLITDYGSSDEFVGLLKSVIRQLAPTAGVIDLCHDIEPYDVRGASLMLARSIQYLAPGVIVGVVDPGVGTSRRRVAVEVAGGRAVFVGPDNGLFAAAVGLIGGADRAVELTNTDLHIPAVGTTFDGRDVFAPVAAHLCAGVPFDELGDPVDPVTLMPGLMPLSRVEDASIVGEVLWVDRFGNCQLNIDPSDLPGDRVGVVVDGRTHRATRVETFADVAPGTVGLLADSYGLVAVVTDRASAAEMLGLSAGAEVTLEPLDDDSNEEYPPAVPVQLGRRPD